MSGNDLRKISSLRDLPREIAPPRDLWKGIEAQIAADKGAAGNNALLEVPARQSARTARWRVLAAAAVIAALAVGVWIGRTVLPVPGAPARGPVLTANNGGGGGTAAPGSPAGNAANGAAARGGMMGSEPGAFHAAYVMGSKYIDQRAQLVKDLEARLAALPPESRAKVMASLQTISDSKRDLERELGRDPSNALLQELLVNTYQDEMRVLTAVHEAGRSGEGI